MKSYNREIAAKEQARYCNDNDLPYFAPFDGYCFHCGMDIYSVPHGYTIQQAASELISYCPHCHRSFSE